MAELVVEDELPVGGLVVWVVVVEIVEEFVGVVVADNVRVVVVGVVVFVI